MATRHHRGSHSGTILGRRELSDVISQIFIEQDVFRIDHYLGRAVQNIMAMRLRERHVRATMEGQLRRFRADYDG